MRARPWHAIAAITGGSFVLYTVVSLLRWEHFDLDSFDLALYHQVVWHLSRFQTPAVSLVGEPNYFGDHFSPILVLLAPLYWVATDVALLVVAQAALIAASIPAVYLYARRRVTEPVAVIVCLAYAQSWGVWAAVDAPLHEVAFAAPLLAWAVYFADCRRWRAAYLCLAGLVLVKEDLGLVVAALGVVLALRGERRHGTAIAAGGFVLFVLVNAVVMPALAPHGWSVRDASLYGPLGDSASSAAVHVFTHPGQALTTLADDPQKVRLVVLLLGAFALLPLLSPLTLLAVPQVLERLLAGDPNLWAPSYQYSLVTMVVLALAAADGVAVLGRWTRRPVAGYALAGSAAVIAVASALSFPLNRLFDGAYWSRTPADKRAQAAVDAVPRGGSVASDWAALAHLPPRDGMYVIGQTHRAVPRYLLVRGSRGSGRATSGYRLARRLPGGSVYRHVGVEVARPGKLQGDG